MKYSLNRYFKKAQTEHWAIGQFNFSTLEQLKGIILAAKDLEAPVIAGTSEGESRFFGIKEAVSLVRNAREEYQVPVFLNLDHGKDMRYLGDAVRAGYDAIHIDGSSLPFKDNVILTKKVIALKGSHGVVVEGEIGHIYGGSEVHSGEALIDRNESTDPEIAADFVTRTGVDSLAVMVGNVHGVYEKMPEIDHNRLINICKRVKSFLVFHGGSGVSDCEIEKVISEGIVKININTELRVAWRDAVKRGMTANENEVKPYKILAGVSEAVRDVVMAKIKLFGSQKKI